MSSLENLKAKKGVSKITVLTAYDYPMAKVLDKAGVDIILVGDSVANVELGLDKTTEVGITEMLHHAKAVRRGVSNSFIVVDMPYDAYQINPSQAVDNARRFIQESQCDAVKVEWFDQCTQVIRSIVEAGIPVMGHVGLTPQTAESFKVQGKDAQTARDILNQSLEIQKAGAFSLVLECVPTELAKKITDELNIFTIGIGAGVDCDGQVLVTHDVLGLFDRFKPKFSKEYVNISQLMEKAVREYVTDVSEAKFPSPEHSFHMNKDELERL